MNDISFQMIVGRKPCLGRLRFSNGFELRRYHRSMLSSTGKSAPMMRDAVEFTRLAAKRWRYYATVGEAAESFAALRRAIRRDGRCEVAFILIASVKLARREMPVGLAYCRRTWCHHLALDFLALHPRAVDETRKVSGVGSGIVFGLVQLANTIGIRRIWGEATANSAPFYEKLLAVRPVRDLFIIEDREMKAIRRRQTTLAS